MTNAVIECILSRSAAKYYDPAVTLSDDQIRELPLCILRMRPGLAPVPHEGATTTVSPARPFVAKHEITWPEAHEQLTRTYEEFWRLPAGAADAAEQATTP